MKLLDREKVSRYIRLEKNWNRRKKCLDKTIFKKREKVLKLENTKMYQHVQLNPKY